MPTILLATYPSEGHGLPEHYHDAVSGAAAAGAQAVGWTTRHIHVGRYRPGQPDQDVAAAMVWSVRGTRGAIIADYTSRGFPVLVLELGGIRRDRGAMHLGLNGLNWLPPEPVHEDRTAEWGIQVASEPRRTTAKAPLVVCGQLGGDAQHNMSEEGIRVWASETIATLRTICPRRPILWRPHPRGRPGPDAVAADGISDPADESLSEVLTKAHAMIMYNSSTGWEALAAGVPVICHPSAPYAPVANTSLLAARHPHWDAAAVHDYLTRLLWCTWTRDQLASGAPFRALAGAGYLYRKLMLRCR